MNSRSIGFRLVGWYSAVSLLVCLGFGICTYFGLSFFLHRAQAEKLHRRSSEIAAILATHLPREGEPFVIDLIRTSYAPENNDRFIRILRPDGSDLYRSGAPADRSFDSAAVPLLPSSQAGEAPVTVTGNLALVRTDAQVGNARYVIECGASSLPDSRLLHRFLAALSSGILLVLLAAVLGGAILVRQALKPVQRIIDGAKVITSSNLSQRLPVAGTSDVLEHLSLTLNQMIARLDEAFQHSRRFTADASHELRTPLTIMRIELESITQEPALDSATREKLSSILEETERMGKLVEGLLTVSRLDAGEAVINITRFDLGELVEATADQIALLAAEKQIAIQCDTTTPVEIAGDRLRIQQVVVNLLDNAIKYTPSGGRIHLATRILGGDALLEVSDTGPGIPPDALPHIFDRFFRADAVRTHTAAGSGLGLSIARSICVAHGGSIRAANQPSGGCRVTVRLPLAPSSPRLRTESPVSAHQATAPGSQAESAPDFPSL